MDAELVERILEPWHINHRVNLMLLEAITPEGLKCTLSARGGRDVGRQFAHMHDVRLWNLEAAAKPLWKGMTRVDPKGKIDRALLERRLTESTEAVATWLGESLAAGGVVKSFKRSAITRLVYFIAHEAHHRGSVLLTLKQCGHKVPQDLAYGIWDWGRI
jgi:uncharacterized damage-inducible protein DinB